MDETEIPQLSGAVKTSFQPIMTAIEAVRAQLVEVKDVVAVRPGYKYPPEGEPVPAVVVAVTPGTAPLQATELEKKFGLAFAVVDATVEEQLAAEHDQPVSFGTPAGSTVSAFEKMLGGDEPLVFLPPKTGSYQEPDPPNLPLVDEPMEMTICVGPEAGWGELEQFLGKTQSTLTVAMYQFTAPHIFKAIEQAVTPADRTFELILHPVPERPAKTGVKANDLSEEDDVIDPLQSEMKNASNKPGPRSSPSKIPKACSRRPITSKSRSETARRSGSRAAIGSHPTSRARIPSPPIRTPCPPVSSDITTAIITPSSRTGGWRRSTSFISSATLSYPPLRPARP